MVRFGGGGRKNVPLRMIMITLINHNLISLLHLNLELEDFMYGTEIITVLDPKKQKIQKIMNASVTYYLKLGHFLARFY